jgi:DNA-binding response OmpR family regulator
MMPGLSGLDFHEELARTHPDDAARIVFLTGGATTTASEEFLARTHSQVMEKPFEMDHLRALAEERVAAAVAREA